MSKEVEIDVKSQVPSKKTKFSCSFIYKVSFKKVWGEREEFSLLKMSIAQAGVGERSFLL